MIYGTGDLIVKLVKADGGRKPPYGTFALPRPTRREYQDWDPEYKTVGMNIQGREVKRLLGYRFRGTYVWTVGELNLADATLLLEVANWQAEGVRVVLQCYSDQPLVRATCVVTSAPIKAVNGMIYADELAISFEGTELRGAKPNPQAESRGRMRIGINKSNLTEWWYQ